MFGNRREQNRELDCGTTRRDTGLCYATVSLTPWGIRALCLSKRHRRFFALGITAARANRCAATQLEASTRSEQACRLNVDIIESYG
jgi:hypothetical protein